MKKHNRFLHKLYLFAQFFAYSIRTVQMHRSANRFNYEILNPLSFLKALIEKLDHVIRHFLKPRLSIPTSMLGIWIDD